MFYFFPYFFHQKKPDHQSRSFKFPESIFEERVNHLEQLIVLSKSFTPAMERFMNLINLSKKSSNHTQAYEITQPDSLLLFT